MAKRAFITGVLGLALMTSCAINITDPGTIPETTFALYDDFRGENILSLRSLEGSPIIINFWGTWCPPCRAEMPDIQTLWEELGDENLIVIGVNTHDQEESARTFMREIGITYPVAKDASGDIAADFKVLGFPATFFIDHSGTVRNTWTGFMTLEQLRENAQLILE